MDLLSKLERHFNSEIKLIQFALDSNWEQAWIIEKEHIPPNLAEIETFLENKFESIACEIFFEDIINNQMFFGIRYLKNKNNILECYQFIYKLCVALSAKSPGLADLIEQISWELRSTPLLSKQPSHLEIGVVDFWKSCGSTILWQQGEPKRLSEENIKEKLKHNQQLICTEKNYQAIEFAFEGEYPHWLGIQIGERKNSIYETNLSSIVDFANELFGFESLVA